MKNSIYHIYNTSIYTDKKKKVDIVIKNGIIDYIGPKIDCISDEYLIDGDGLIVYPSLIDIHTHVRSLSEDNLINIYNISNDAALSGYSTICMMPNNDIIIDSFDEIDKFNSIKNQLHCNVIPIAAVTEGLNGTTHVDPLNLYEKYGIRLFSDDGKSVSDIDILIDHLKLCNEFGGKLIQHAQSPNSYGLSLSDKLLSNEYGIKRYNSLYETSVVARDATIANSLKSEIHFTHVSSYKTVNLLKLLKGNNDKITFDVTPHHLYLSIHKDLIGDSIHKVNPPLSNESSRIKLLELLNEDSIIDMISTDHAPHIREDKITTWLDGKFGIPGLRFAFPIMKTLIDDDIKIVNLMSFNPSKFLGIGSNHVACNQKANLFLYNPIANTIYDDLFYYEYSPYASKGLKGSVLYHFINGELIVKNGMINS